jgi:hypothetical protein
LIKDTFLILVILLKQYIEGYHTTDMYNFRVDAAVFDLCLRKHSKALHAKMANLFLL